MSPFTKTPILLKIKKEIENIKKTKYNFVLVNKYENGEHNMGFHADDEDEIDQSVPICSGTIHNQSFFYGYFYPRFNSHALKKFFHNQGGNRTPTGARFEIVTFGLNGYHLNTYAEFQRGVYADIFTMSLSMS